MSNILNNLENKSIEFYIGVVNFILILYLLYRDFNKKEGFAVADDINTAINTRYGADVDAIRNLSNLATQLTTGGLTIPGTVTINGNLKVIGNIELEQGKFALNDNPLMIRGIGDEAHHIKFDGETSGPLITGVGCGIKSTFYPLKVTGNVELINGKFALNDNPLMIRGIGDEAHHIKFDNATLGPLITGVGVGIKSNNGLLNINERTV